MTKEQLIKERFPNSKIYKLQAERKKIKQHRILDKFLYLLTNVPTSICETKNSISDVGLEFYLIKHDLHYYLAVNFGDKIESKPIDESIVEDEFECGDWKFVNKGLLL